MSNYPILNIKFDKLSSHFSQFNSLLELKIQIPHSISDSYWWQGVDSVEMKKKLFNLIYLQHTSSSTEKQNTIINGYRNFQQYISYIMATSFKWWKKLEYPERTTDHGWVTGNLYHLWLWVECILFCNLQSRERTHAVLVTGLYELLENPTT
jgi:hypothetical protein